MSKIIDCEFTSAWDGESQLLTTAAKYNVETGLVFDIKACKHGEEDEVNTLDRQYATIAGADFDFTHPTESFTVANPDEVRLRLSAAANLENKETGANFPAFGA